MDDSSSVTYTPGNLKKINIKISHIPFIMADQNVLVIVARGEDGKRYAGKITWEEVQEGVPFSCTTVNTDVPIYLECNRDLAVKLTGAMEEDPTHFDLRIA